MAALDKLAAEVLLMIGAYVQDEADLASLVRVCRRLYCTLDHELYKRDVQTGLPLSVLWGSRFGLQGTLEKAHMAGANLEQAWMSRIRSIFPDLSLTGNFTIDEIPTAASVTATTKKYHNSLFKHIPPFFKRFPHRPASLTPHPSINPDDKNAPVGRTAVSYSTVSFPNNFLICQELYAARRPASMPQSGGIRLTWPSCSATTTWSGICSRRASRLQTRTRGVSAVALTYAMGRRKYKLL
ncbi:hypothetical protein B0T20DRAFT_100437 [Sordaria brevicollis]|uniref:F-box domain-containing protein n=1 Tax=Sordaria brevicollis TaxID=83679 RepID=A0AAE0U2L7_SORBR|nr:hypothetical protein B0T20DRAFT_100437 [Sordaria brevicollis]